MTGFRVALGWSARTIRHQTRYDNAWKDRWGRYATGRLRGRADIMDNVMPAGKVYQAGTLAGNPLATAAGTKTLELLVKNPPYNRLEAVWQAAR